MRASQRCAALFALVFGLTEDFRGLAQEPSLTPPRILEFVEAELPESAPSIEHEIAVRLELTIDSDGIVTNATVIESGGALFDEAARTAALRFRCEPARRDGDPVGAIIQYRYVFEPPPAIGRLAGRLLDVDGSGVANANITARSVESGATLTVTSLVDGTFAFSELPAGAHQVRIVADGFHPFEHIEIIGAGEAADAIYRLESIAASDPEATFEIVAVVDRPRWEVTRHTIPREQLTRVPGTRGDALRVIEILPGVARPPFGLGTLLVRGSAPEDTQVFLEGGSVPLLYHFSGLTSFFNSQLLERIDLVPGNFSSRYGRGLGGIVDLGVRDPATDRAHGVIDLNVIDASAMVEGPIGENFSLGGSFRRSVIDLVFDKIASSESTDIVAAPVYYDYQLVGSWRPSNRDRIRMMSYGSHDAFRLFFPETIGEDPTIQGATDLRVQFHFGQLEWRHRYSDDTEHTIQLQVGPTSARYNYGRAITVDLQAVQLNARAEWRTQLSSRVALTVGADFAGGRYSLAYDGPELMQLEGRGYQASPGAYDRVSLEGDGFVVRPGIYAEAELRPSDRVQLIAGMRADYFEDIGVVTVNPRLAMIVSATPHLRLKFGAGLFSQPPLYYETDPQIGNPDLGPAHAIHISTGIEGEVGENFAFSLEGFYKRLFERVVTGIGIGGPDGGFQNGGEGQIYGGEVSLRFPPTEQVPFFGYVSYTLSRSERVDHPGQPTRLFDFDQTHILALSGVYQFRRGWEIGATFRLASGNPETPVVGAIYNADTDTFLPINGPINSERNPFYHRLDLRVQKRWTFDHFRLAIALDIQNVYNARNRELTAYSHDYSQTTSINGLPIIPSLSIRGEF